MPDPSSKRDATLSDEDLVMLAQAFHEEYREQQRNNKPPDDPSMRPWDALDEGLRQSNLDLAADVPRKLKAIDCELAPGRSTQSFVLSPKEVETLAAAEHDRWNHERWGQGWTLGDRDVAAKRSPYLVDYNELPDDVKKWDRDVVQAIPRVLARIDRHPVRLTRPRVFVVRDFTTPGLRVLLDGAIEDTEGEFDWDVPAITDKAPLDEIYKDVLGRVHAAHYVLACMDSPNGNVGYEVGHALGHGARLALFSIQGQSPPKWLDHSPFEAYGVPRIDRSADLVELLRNATETPQRIPQAAIGDKLTIIAPKSGPSAEVAGRVGADAQKRGVEVLLVQQPEWNWRDAPTRLAGTGRVLVCFELPPGGTGDATRDGGPNTTSAAIAGYLGVHVDRRPLALQDSGNPRRLVDFGGQIREYSSLAEARQIARNELGY